MAEYTRYKQALTDRLRNDWEIGDALVKEAQSEGDLVACEYIARDMDVALSADRLRVFRFAASKIKTAKDRKALSPGVWNEALHTFPGTSLEVIREHLGRMAQEGGVTVRKLREEKARRSQDILTLWAETFVQNHEVAIEELREMDEESRTWVFRTFPEVKKYLDGLDALTGILADVPAARERQSDTKAVAALEKFRKDPAGVAAELLALRPSDRNGRLITLLSAVPVEEEDDLLTEIEEAFRNAVLVDPEAVSELTDKVEAHLTPQRVTTKMVMYLIAANEPISEANHFVAENEDVVHALNETQRDAILDALRTFGESNSELQARLEIGGIQYVSDITGSV